MLPPGARRFYAELPPCVFSSRCHFVRYLDLTLRKVDFDDSQSVDEPQDTRPTLRDRPTVSVTVVY